MSKGYAGDNVPHSADNNERNTADNTSAAGSTTVGASTTSSQSNSVDQDSSVNSQSNVIRGLPHAAKVVLCVAVSLSQVWSPTSEISISVLKKYCVEATHHAIMDELSLGHVMSLVEMLLDARLLMPGNSGQFNPHDPNAKLQIAR